MIGSCWTFLWLPPQSKGRKLPLPSKRERYNLLRDHSHPPDETNRSLGWDTARRDQVLLSGGRAGPNSLELNLCFSTQEVGIQEQAGYA